MNEKEDFLFALVDMVIDCCKINLEDAEELTREAVFSNSKDRFVYMTRVMVVYMILFKGGYSDMTVGALFKLSKKTRPKVIARWIGASCAFEETSDAYYTAIREARRRYALMREELRKCDD